MPVPQISAGARRRERRPAGTSRSAPSSLARLQANAHQATELLKALAHPGRLVILCKLVEQDRSVTELARMLAMRQPAVSQRLARLRADGLVEARRNGKSVRYSIGRPEVKRIVAVLEKVFC
jgi:DNA-binding transcriptional ArsR family regulator